MPKILSFSTSCFIAPSVRLGSYPSSTETSRSWRPLMPPASLIAPNAVSTPSFIWRPSSLAGPLNGAAMPKRISLSVTPLTSGTRGAGAGAVGVAAATAAGAEGAGAVAEAAALASSSDVAGGVTVTVWTGRVELAASCGAAAGGRASLVNR